MMVTPNPACRITMEHFYHHRWQKRQSKPISRKDGFHSFPWTSFNFQLVQIGETMPLKIFEPRYQIMFESVMGTEPPTEPNELACGLFGIVREKTSAEIEQDEEIGETEWRSEHVGTVLEVRHSTRTEEGQMVFCQALHRINVSDVERNLFGYWSGNAVVTDPSPRADVNGLDEVIGDAKDAYQEFLKIKELGMEPWEQGALVQILDLHSDNWLRLTHWLAARLPVSAAQKQSILESDDPIFRLLKLKVEYVKLAVHFARNPSLED
eukprot:m.253012 g.253012  ORF g.253012 m.253012 type:complete len:266 (+) comp15926_c0_seq4:1544-2341(+)